MIGEAEGEDEILGEARFESARIYFVSLPGGKVKDKAFDSCFKRQKSLQFVLPMQIHCN